jgi:hypothetical protein
MLASNFDWNMIFGMPNVFLVFGIGFGSLIAIIGIVAGTWEKVQRNRSLVDLKLLLIERGLSAGRDRQDHQRQAGRLISERQNIINPITSAFGQRRHPQPDMIS